MKGKKWNKLLAGIMSVACVVTSLPAGAFAAEAVTEAEAETIVFEENEPDTVVTEDEEVIEMSEDIADIFEAGASDGEASDVVDADNADVTETGSRRSAPISAKLETETSCTVNPKKGHEEDEATDERVYYDSAFFVFNIEKNGYYHFESSAEDYTTFVLASSDQYFSSYSKKYLYLELYSSDREKTYSADVHLHPGTYYLYGNVDKDTTDGDTERSTFNFKLSFKEEVYANKEVSPVQVKIGETYSQKFANIDPKDDEDEDIDYYRHYYRLELPTAGVMTIYFADDDPDKDNGSSRFVITHADNNDKDRQTFEYKLESHDYESFSTANFTWVDKDTVRIGMIKGTYNIYLEGNQDLTYRISFKDFKPLKADNKEELLEDTRPGGSNDKVDFLDTDWGGYYEGEGNGMPEIKTNQSYKGILTDDSLYDDYYFKLDNPSGLYLTASSDDVAELDFSLYQLYTWPDGSKTVREMSLDTDHVKTTCQINKSLTNEQLKFIDGDDHNAVKATFPKGEYAIRIEGWKNNKDDATSKYGKQGIYSLVLSTKTVKPPKSVSLTKMTLSASLLEIGKDSEGLLTATVLPKNAETSVKCEIAEDPDGVIRSVTVLDPDATKPNVNKIRIETNDKAGSAKIKVITNSTNKKGKQLEKECTIAVLDSRTAAPIITKQKIDITSAAYFGAEYDKYVVKNGKKYGTIKKGIYTSKKASDPDDTIRIVGYKKDGKTYVPKCVLSFATVTPAIHNTLTAKGKPGKSVNLNNSRPVSIDDLITAELVESKPEALEEDLDAPVLSPDATTDGLMPYKYEVTGKKWQDNFEYNEKEHAIRALKKGTCKVNVYYGKDSNEKNNAKYTITIKSFVSIKQSVNVKISAKKAATVKLSGIAKTPVPVWRVTGVDESGMPDGTEIKTEDNKLDIEPAANGLSVKLKGKTAGTYALIATTGTGDDTVEYVCIVTVTD